MLRGIWPGELSSSLWKRVGHAEASAQAVENFAGSGELFAMEASTSNMGTM